MTSSAAAPSVIPEALPAVTVPFCGVEDRLRASARDSSVASSRGCSSRCDDDVALPRRGTLTGAISASKRPAASTPPGLLLAGERELRPARRARCPSSLRELLGGLAHQHLRQRAGEAVLVHRVDHGRVAEAVAACACFGEQEGQAAHALGAAGDDDLGCGPSAIDSAASCRAFRPEPQAMFTVQAGTRIRDPGAHADLARDVRAAAGLARVAEDELVDALADRAPRARAAPSRPTRPRSAADRSANAPRNLPIGVRSACVTTTDGPLGRRAAGIDSPSGAGMGRRRPSRGQERRRCGAAHDGRGAPARASGDADRSLAAFGRPRIGTTPAARKPLGPGSAGRCPPEPSARA